MTIKILKNIPFTLNRDHLLDLMRIKERKSLAEEFITMVKEAEKIAKPKGLFKKIEIEKKNEDSVVLEGVKFTSRVLRVNLDKTDAVYPALATCGLELEEWSKTKTELLHNFWAETIKEGILTLAVAEILKQINEIYNSGSTSLMTPGSLNDWPLEEQANLFNLFENSHGEIGVSLTNSFLMRPLKTISCLIFGTEEAFLSCQLCSRERCSNRRVPFEEGLFEMKYQISTCVNPEDG